MKESAVSLFDESMVSGKELAWSEDDSTFARCITEHFEQLHEVDSNNESLSNHRRLWMETFLFSALTERAVYAREQSQSDEIVSGYELAAKYINSRDYEDAFHTFKQTLTALVSE